TVHWVPGHSDVHGNEEADKHAKLAAEGHHNNSSTESLPCYLHQHILPLSISALKEQQSKDTAEQWKHLWHNTPPLLPSEPNQPQPTQMLLCQTHCHIP
ncbi:hypothetical protein BDR06DRAFT_898809, partial [Suillus hirtellus]